MGHEKSDHWTGAGHGYIQYDVSREIWFNLPLVIYPKNQLPTGYANVRDTELLIL